MILNKSDTNTILLAEKLYMLEGKTLIEIARQIGKSEKTVRNWKEKYGWDAKKAEYLNSIRNLPQQLYEDYCAVMKSIRDDLANGREIASQRYNLASKLFDQIPKAAEVEKAARGIDSKKTDPEEFRKIMREELGLEQK